ADFDPGRRSQFEQGLARSHHLAVVDGPHQHDPAHWRANGELSRAFGGGAHGGGGRGDIGLGGLQAGSRSVQRGGRGEAPLAQRSGALVFQAGVGGFGAGGAFTRQIGLGLGLLYGGEDDGQRVAGGDA